MSEQKTDIVERLRDIRNRSHLDPSEVEAVFEAADEISRLREENKGLREAMEESLRGEK